MEDVGLSASPVCRSCGENLRTTFVDLGRTPLANSYPHPDSDPSEERRYPLHAWVCDGCLLVQLEEIVPAEDIFSDYAYFSSFSASWVEHARQFAETAVARFGLGPQALVVEIASNDGYLLRHFCTLGVPVLGIEPAANVAEVAEVAGIPTEVAFFTDDSATRLAADGRRADLLVANNVVAHVPDLNGFVAGMQTLLAPGGTISIEVPHLLNLIREVQFDTIYHEHFSYFSLHALEPVLTRHGLRVLDVEQLSTHGGSLRVLACHVDDPRPEGGGAAAVRNDERSAGLDRMETYAEFGAAVARCCDALRSFVREAKDRGESVVAYGAAAKGNTLLNSAGLAADEIEYVVDRSPHKQGRLLPGTRLPIRDPDVVARTKPRWLLVLPWNLLDEVTEQMSHIRSWGGQFVTAVPTVEVHP